MDYREAAAAEPQCRDRQPERRLQQVEQEQAARGTKVVMRAQQELLEPLLRQPVGAVPVEPHRTHRLITTLSKPSAALALQATSPAQASRTQPAAMGK
jgi:hypothetical protein